MGRVEALVDHFFVEPVEPDLVRVEGMFFVVVAAAAFVARR